MKKNVILSGVIGSFLLFGALVCHAEKWDKNDFKDETIESAYYDADSIKVQNKRVSWTEKYIYNAAGIVSVTKRVSKYEACKQRISKKGDVTQFQGDTEIENNKFRVVAKRYYNKDNELVCSDKDMGSDFKISWEKIVRRSPIQDAYYDLVSKYKVNLQK